MKRFVLIAITLLFITPFTFSQRYIFYEDFSNNDNDWTVESGDDYVIKLDNGKYTIDNFTDGALKVWNHIDLSDYTKYTISIRLKLRRGTPKTAYGVFWSSDMGGDDQAFNILIIQGDGQCGVLSRYNDDIYFNTGMLDVKQANGLGQYNIIEIVRNKSKYTFYINGKKIASAENLPVFDDNLGFYIGGKSCVDVDYVKIKR